MPEVVIQIIVIILLTLLSFVLMGRSIKRDEHDKEMQALMLRLALATQQCASAMQRFGQSLDDLRGPIQSMAESLERTSIRVQSSENDHE